MLVEGNRMFPPNSVDSVTSNNEREKKIWKKKPGKCSSNATQPKAPTKFAKN